MLGFRDFVPRQGFQQTLALSPDASTVAYSSNAGGHYNLWTVLVSGGEPRQLTRFTGHAVRQISWAPDGKSLVFSADRGGDEQYRLYQISVDGERGPTDISSDTTCQRILATSPFDADGRFLVYAANDRDDTVQDILIRDLAKDTERRVVPPPGVVYEPVGISPDGRWLLTGGFRSHSQVDAYLIDLQDTTVESACVTAGQGDGFFEPGPWAADSAGFYLRTKLWGEYISAAYYHLDSGTIEPVARHDWDVEHVEIAGDTLVWSVNADGRSILHIRRGDEELRLPAVPPGVITALAVASAAEPIAVLFDAATRPSEVALLDTVNGFRYVTEARPPGLTVIEAVDPVPVVYPSASGRGIHALFYRPHTPGPHPVLLSIHGGPEAQERPMYPRSGLYQHLLAQGVAIFAPNIAGSTGYGATHQQLIYRDWGGVDLDDLEHAVHYLQAHPDVDHNRIAVMGGSYGGFAALSCLSRLPYEWAAGVSLCGPTNLVTLAQACPPTWKTFVATVLGDPDVDAEYLTQRSPVTHADAITAPLFVLQGARDPRVPRAESDQLVSRLRGRDVRVRYDVFDDEGHGFTNRENELRAYEEIARFLCSHLIKM